MRLALLLAALLLLTVAAPSVSAGPVADACEDHGLRRDCVAVLLLCRSTDPTMDEVCVEVINPLARSL